MRATAASTVDVGVGPPPPRSRCAMTSSLGAGEGHATGRWHNNRHRIDDDDCHHRHSGGANARRGDCDADNRCARYRGIDDDRGGIVLTIKNKKYNNQQAGLLALALGGPPVGVRLMGGGFARLAGSSVRWAGHRWGFVSWAGHHPLRQRGRGLNRCGSRDGGIRGGGG